LTREGSELLARHVSSDGVLTLRVDRELEDGSPVIIMGFEDSGWHFHPTADEAMRIVAEVLADRVVVLCRTVDGRREFELLDELEVEFGSHSADGTYGFRTWSRPVTFDELAAGVVPYVPLSKLWNWRS
jgi:hypothetical protein